ncbi:hypothetical protein GOP47_0021129, partial [Adiantum capillus-veneris]
LGATPRSPSAHCPPLSPQWHDRSAELDQQRLVTFSPKLRDNFDQGLNKNHLLSPWIHNRNKHWVQEDRRPTWSPKYRASSAEHENAELSLANKEQIAWTAKKIFQEEAQEEEEEDISCSSVDGAQYNLNGDEILVAALSSYSKHNDLENGRRVHAQIVRKGLLKTNVFVGNSLINLYAKSGSLVKAREVFEEVSNRNVISWNGLIAGYSQHKHGDMAFHCFEQMQLDGISPNRATFLSLLKACSSLRKAVKGQELHSMIVKEGSLEKNVRVANALVDMYAKCGMLERAEEVFGKLLVRDVVTWNSLISGYAEDDCGEEALVSFKLMQEQGILPDDITFVAVLRACISVGAPSTSDEIYTCILARGSLESNIAVATALIDMYGKRGLLVRAEEAFNKLVTRMVVTWNALIAGYIQHEHFEKAFVCYSQMQQNSVLPDGVTFLCMLKACGSIRAGDRGLALHDEIARAGLCKITATANALIDMYGKCGLIEKAQEVFGDLVSRNVVSWNSMIAGFAQEAQYDKALKCFDNMQMEGFSPDAVTFVCVLKVYSSIKDTNKGLEVHATITKFAFLEEETVVSNALMNLYADCGMLAEAQEVFDSLSNRTVASWNTLIAGFAEHDHEEEALQLLDYMQADGFSPNAITFFSALKACGNVGTVHRGQIIHSTIVKHGLVESDPVVGTAVVDMYASCGMLEEAHQLFDKSPMQDVVLWNVLIAGHAQLGQADLAFDRLDLMISERKSPDITTFTTVLNVCNHTGLVEKCQTFFQSMTTDYATSPNSEICNCVVDLFARAGHLDEAIAMIEGMPFFASPRVWHIVMGAAQKFGNIKLGKMAFTHAAQMNEVDAGAYVSIRNMLAAVDTEEGSLQPMKEASVV